MYAPRGSVAGPRPTIVLALVMLAALVQAGCGGTAGAWLWWLTDPEEKVKAEHKLGKGRLLILIDEDKGWLADPSVRPLLMEALIKQLSEHDVNENVVSQEVVTRLRQKDPQFERRGAREVGQRVKAEQVLHLNVRKFTLLDETVKPAYRGRFSLAAKVLNVKATTPEDVRVWPRSPEGRIVEVTTDLHAGKGATYGEKLTRRLCEEMAEKVAKLFYDHTVPKRL